MEESGLVVEDFFPSFLFSNSLRLSCYVLPSPFFSFPLRVAKIRVFFSLAVIFVFFYLESLLGVALDVKQNEIKQFTKILADVFSSRAGKGF